jgi:phosphopantothenoylcysteine decarboxylase/phosphopantothenate--cysteine ligase
MLVANIGPDTFGLDENELLVIEEKGNQRFTRSNKLDLSRQLISLISTKI